MSSLKNHKSPLRLLLIAAALLVFLLLVYLFGGRGLYTAPFGQPDLPTLTAAALQNTFAAPTYRFTAASSLQLDEKTRLFSLLKGEVAEGGSHIEGSILGTPVNVYYQNGHFYQQDPIDQSWHISAVPDSASAAALISELDPEANFRFTELGQLTDLGTEKLNGRKTQVVQLQPILQDHWISRYFQDLTYTLWIDRRAQVIVKALITAVGQDSARGVLTIETTFSDFGAALSLQLPPDVV